MACDDVLLVRAVMALHGMGNMMGQSNIVVGWNFILNDVLLNYCLYKLYFFYKNI